MRVVQLLLALCVSTSIGLAQVTVDTAPPGSEQERLNMISRAFERLPPDELERFDIDLSTPVIVNTLRAANLKVAWAKRQEELKEAMANVVKPAEFMADIALKLREKKQNLTESLDSLRELESLLGDIDNSRDYYTIGGWSILTNMLHPSNRVEQQELAAWAIGTAVKNSYDFQLWVLESDFTHPSVLSLKKNKKRSHDMKVSSIENNNPNDDIRSNEVEDLKIADGDKADEEFNVINSANEENNSNRTDVTTVSMTLVNSPNNRTDASSELISKNKKSDIKVFSGDKVTGLEKLVSLLHWSYYIEKNGRNKPNLDELQRKVLYAISSCARGNMEVQEALQIINKNDLYPLEMYNSMSTNRKYHYEINKINDNTDNVIIADQSNSFFMKYLTAVAESNFYKNTKMIDNDGNDGDNYDNNNNYDSNNYGNNDNDNDNNNDNDNDNNDNEYLVSYDLSRKVWTFISDMLEERSYIRGDLTQFQDLPKDAMKELLSLKLFGDLFLNEKWLNLAMKTFQKVYTVYTKKTEIEVIIGINAFGEVKDDSKNILDPGSKVTQRSLLKNILIVIKEIFSQNESMKNNFQTQIQRDDDIEIKRSIDIFLFLLKSIVSLNESEVEGIAEESKTILTLLQPNN